MNSTNISSTSARADRAATAALRAVCANMSAASMSASHLLTSKVSAARRNAPMGIGRNTQVVRALIVAS